MMREYLFHGKRKDNGEWVEGFFYCFYNFTRTVAQILTDRTNGIPDAVEVIPETVGQYTWLENMNGVKIFDGDIVMFHEKKYIVRREDEIPGGYWWSTAYILQEVGVDDYLSFEETVDEYCNEICVEVIGNIHDNPELLKGGDPE